MAQYEIVMHNCLMFTFFSRIQKKVVSLQVYKEGDWLRLETLRERYDSIKTLVMYRASSAISIPMSGYQALAYLRYPVNSSYKYYHSIT